MQCFADCGTSKSLDVLARGQGAHLVRDVNRIAQHQVHSSSVAATLLVVVMVVVVLVMVVVAVIVV